MTESTVTPLSDEQAKALRAAKPEVKPGRKSSEFFFSGSATAGLLALIPVESDWRVRIAFAVVAGAVAITYNHYRFQTKAPSAEVRS